MLQDPRAGTMWPRMGEVGEIIRKLWTFGLGSEEREDITGRTGEEPSRQREEHKQRLCGLTWLAFGRTVRTLLWLGHKGQVSKSWLTSTEKYIHSSALNVHPAGG